jgi:RNA polymerase sigma-70 factor (family 1)
LFLKKKNPPSEKPDIRTTAGFEAVYNLYFEKMYAFCRGKINSAFAAEEIVHDIFRSLWERRETIQIDAPMEHYLMRSAKLKIIDYFREQEVRKKHFDAALIDFYDSENFTENDVDFNELKHRVDTLVDMLPDQCRSVYSLSRQKGMSHKEIASALFISTKTVENHMTKALSFLRQNLKEYNL